MKLNWFNKFVIFNKRTAIIHLIIASVILPIFFCFLVLHFDILNTAFALKFRIMHHIICCLYNYTWEIEINDSIIFKQYYKNRDM